MNDEVDPLVDKTHGDVHGEHCQGQWGGEYEREDASSRDSPGGDEIGGVHANVVEWHFVVALVDVVPQPVLGT